MLVCRRVIPLVLGTWLEGAASSSRSLGHGPRRAGPRGGANGRGREHALHEPPEVVQREPALAGGVGRAAALVALGSIAAGPGIALDGSIAVGPQYTSKSASARSMLAAIHSRSVEEATAHPGDAVPIIGSHHP